ncbi:head GIN domain-containing protein [Corallibacter sp.]|uniref:head GIN domain-containing protein n=1 Tax=Corallibacter sp. TaxID=2038084 RepID=UPI003AB617B0
MTTITKIIISIALSLMVLSCQFDINSVHGNGNVTTSNRSVNKSFNKIKASRGLDVYLTQSNDESVSVEADENLQEIIITEVENDVLKIYASENIGQASARKVFVNFKNISAIKASSGSDVFSTNTIIANDLDLASTSGSDLILDVKAKTIDCKSSSGSDLELSGTVDHLIAQASSGSDIEASELKSITSRVKASSGAEIVVNTSKELIAKASSGGDVTYYGNPERVDKSDGVSGSITKQ